MRFMKMRWKEAKSRFIGVLRISLLPFREKAGFSVAGLFFAFSGEAVVFVDVERVPRVVDPPIGCNQAAEIGDIGREDALFLFDFLKIG